MSDKYEKNVSSLAKQFIAQSKGQLGRLLQINKDVKKEIKEMIVSSGIIQATYNAYGNIDNVIAKAIENDPAPISCHNCVAAYCCHQNVEICEAEAKIIGQYCKEENIIIPKSYLQEQLKYNKDQIAQVDCSACVFLKNNRCSIYPVRPTACRTYYVQTPIEYCDTKKYKGHVIGQNSNPLAEMIKMALFDVGGKSGRMPKMLIKYSK